MVGGEGLGPVFVTLTFKPGALNPVPFSDRLF